MYCQNCGASNDDNAKFCKSCGKALENDSKPAQIPKTNNKNNLIIIGLISVVVILIVCVIFAGGFLNGNVPLETKDFEIFKMDIPKGAEFVETNSMPDYGY